MNAMREREREREREGRERVRERRKEHYGLPSHQKSIYIAQQEHIDSTYEAMRNVLVMNGALQKK